MKKIILQAAFLFSISFGLNAQVDQLESGTTPQNFTESVADCTYLVANDNLYGGAINASIYASKFIISQGETFQASEVTMLLGVVDDPSYLIDEDTEFKFTIFSDDGEPGTEITSTIVTPTTAVFTETVTLTSGAIWDLYEINVDLSTLDLISSHPSFDTNFFFGIEMTEDDGVQVGLNFTQAATGSITYLNDGTGWQLFNAAAPDNLSFTYLLEGDCAPLSVNDFLSSQISLFPNPTTDVINVNAPSNVEITGVAMYDVLGRNTGATISNGVINVANLSRGVYILSLETTAGTLTQKIVKK